MEHTINTEFYEIGQDRLKKIRKDLYLPDGVGYVLFENFINQQQANYLRQVYLEKALKADSLRPLPPKQAAYYRDCPPYISQSTSKYSLHLMSWNIQTVDMFSRDLLLSVHALRCQISSMPVGMELFGSEQNCTSFRVTNTRNSESDVQEHSDWYSPNSSFNKNHDPSRLQAVLFLSTPGVDYGGSGFGIRPNVNQEARFPHFECKSPLGTLMLFQYWRPHFVSTVSSVAPQTGFLRVLFPPEQITSRSRAKTLFYVGKRLIKRVARKITN